MSVIVHILANVLHVVLEDPLEGTPENSDCVELNVDLHLSKYNLNAAVDAVACCED